MSRLFKRADYDATPQQAVTLAECLPPDHLARFLIDVIAQVDFAPFSRRYGPRGGGAAAPALRVGLLIYGYATGVFSRRTLERAPAAAVPFRVLAGHQQPDHDPLATFRATFLAEVQALFVQGLLVAQEVGGLRLGNSSIDGTKVHADAATSKAVSSQRLGELASQGRAEVAALFALAEQADQGAVPDGLVVAAEIARRQERLARLAEATAVLEARATERDAAEQAA